MGTIFTSGKKSIYRSLQTFFLTCCFSASTHAQFIDYTGWLSGSFTYTNATSYPGFTASYVITNSGSSYYQSSTPKRSTAVSPARDFLDLTVNWPNRSNYTTLNITFSKGLLGVYFYIGDIDNGGSPGTFTDSVTVSATDINSSAVTLTVNPSLTVTPAGTTSTQARVKGFGVNCGGSTDLDCPTTITFDPNAYVKTISIRYSSGSTAPSDPGTQRILISRIYFAVILPVQFQSFSAEAANDNALLKWNVSDETLEKPYIIERSSDGLNFHPLAQIASKNLQGTSNYQYTDRLPKQGNNFYRVQYINETGQIKYSDIKKIYFSKPARGATIYPNPVKEQLNLFTGDFTNIRSAEIINAYGSRVNLVNVTYDHSIINTNNLPAGMYFLMIQYKDGTREKLQFIKQ